MILGQLKSSLLPSLTILGEIIDPDLGQALTKCALMEEFTKSSIYFDLETNLKA